MNRPFIMCVLLLGAGCVWSGCDSNNETPASATATPADEAPVFGAEVAQWPSYPAGEYFQHGNAGEGPYRDRINAACVAQGLNTLYISQPAPGDESAMHLMWLKSPVDGHFMNSMENSYIRASAAGVSRYIFDIGNASAATMDRWKFLTKDYPNGTVQWVLSGRTYASLP